MVKEEDQWAIDAFDKLRKKYELRSDAALAELLGTSRSMVSVVRSGQSRPSAKMVFQLADKLGWLNTVAGVAKVAGMLAGPEVGAAVERAVLDQVTKKIQGKEEKGV